MPRANVSLNDVALLAGTIRREDEDFSALADQLNHYYSSTLNRVESELARVKGVEASCQEKINQIGNQISALQEELQGLEAQLAATPPVLVVTTTDEEGNTTTTEEPNPEYELLVAKIKAIQGQIEALEAIKEAFEELWRRAQQEEELLVSASDALTLAKEGSQKDFASLRDFDENACGKLRDIDAVITRYRDEVIPTPSYLSHEARPSLAWLQGLRPAHPRTLSDPQSLKNCAPQLEKTKQKKGNKVKINGQEMQVFGDPEETKKRLLYHQGENALHQSGDSGLLSLANNLRKAGVIVDENTLIQFVSRQAPSGEIAPGNSIVELQGQSLESRLQLFLYCGIPCQWKEVLSEKDLAELADFIEEGKAVQLSLNAGIFWDQDNLEKKDYREAYGSPLASLDPKTLSYRCNHVITPLSPGRDETGKLLGFLINDTGRGFPRDALRYVPLEDLLWASAKCYGSVMIYSTKAIW